MKLKKVLALTLAAVLCLGLFAGCGDTGSDNSGSPAPSDSSSPAPSDSSSPAPSDSNSPAESPAPAAEGSVYYLNFKPEQDGDWQTLAQTYTAQAGVPCFRSTAPWV